MSEPVMSWTELASMCEGQGLLAKRLYVVLSEPAGGPEAIRENLPQHLAYQARLEKEGIMFAAGPLADDAEREWHGAGIFVYRAGSRAEAVELARADPMHASGARSFTVRPWMLNEGTFSVRISYSGEKPQIA